MEVKEKDWKLFRAKLSGWQENYMDKLNKEYIEILSDSSKLASEKFWELDKRIRKDKKDTGVLCDMRRSMLTDNLISLLSEQAITLDDLKDFSDELKQEISEYTKRSKAIFKHIV